MKKTKIILCTVLMTIAIAACASALVGCDRNAAPSYTLTYSADTGGYISGKTEQTVKEGGRGETVTAVALDGYMFTAWSDGSTNPERRDENVNTDISVTAGFEKLDAETKYYTLTYTASIGGHVDGETEQTVPSRGNGKSVTAVAHDGYKFVQWSDGRTSAYRTDIHVTSNGSFEATFAELQYFTIRYNAESGGYIDGDTNQSVLERSKSTEVTAVAERGYEFSHWSDGYGWATRSDVCVTDKTYTAYFKKAIRFTLQYNADETKGYISGETTQSVLRDEDGTTVTAIPNAGYEFYKWSDDVETASRTDIAVTDNINVTAMFRVSDFEYIYEVYRNSNGRIDGEAHQIIKRNELGTAVTAVPDDGYMFNGWSDGVTDITRRDRGRWYGVNGSKVISDDNPRITIYAKFTQYLTVTYKVENDIGGHIAGTLNQILYSNYAATEVTAVPDDGYVFVGWSDGVTNPTRREEYLVRDFSSTAYFEPLIKTFTYDYCGGNNGVNSQTVSVYRDDPKAARFAVPTKIGYTFGGWYADDGLTLRVTDDEGELMLGYNTVSLATDTLYARWIDPEDKTVRYKVLVVIVDEIDAMLRSRITGVYKRYTYKISLQERKIYEQIAERTASYLNEWFDGKVIFEVDTYFTTRTIGSGSFVLGTEIPPSNYLFADRIDEVKGINDKYDTVLSVFNLNDLNYEFSDTYGCAVKKYGAIFSATFMQYIDMYSLEQILDKSKGDATKGYDTQVWKRCNEVCIHEMIHTIENYAGTHNYHDAMYTHHYDDVTDLERSRLFLLNEAQLNGETVGIPPEFWANWNK